MIKNGQCLIYTLMLVYCIFGSLSLILVKLQNLEEAFGVKFKHPWFQTQIMFFGLSFCLLIYKTIKYCYPKYNTTHEHDEDGNLKVPPKKLLYLVPAILDIFAFAFSLMTILNLPIDIYAMLRGVRSFIKIFITHYMFGNRQHRHHVIGKIIMIVSVVMIGVVYFMYREEIDKQDRNETFGYISMLINTFLTSFQYFLEERLMFNYKANMLEVAGWQGIFGGITCLLILVLFQLVPCNEEFLNRDEFCAIDDRKEYFMENSLFALRQLWENKIILLYIISYMFVTCIDNILGLSLSKFTGIAKRSLTDSFRPALVWLFFLVVPTKNKEKFIEFQIVSYLLLLLGGLIFLEIIPLPKCLKKKVDPKKAESLMGLESKYKKRIRNIRLENQMRELSYNPDSIINEDEDENEEEIKEIPSKHKSNAESAFPTIFDEYKLKTASKSFSNKL